MIALPHVPVSWGELLDKITILEIKTERLPDPAARANTARELALLRAVAGPGLEKMRVRVAELKALNLNLWDIEDGIRDHERNQNFGSAFIALARAVYKTNDARGALKRSIDQAMGSYLTEEKSYRPY